MSSFLDHCSAGEPPDIPDVMTNWHHALHLEVVLLDVAHIRDDMLQLPVSGRLLLCSPRWLLLAILEHTCRVLMTLPNNSCTSAMT